MRNESVTFPAAVVSRLHGRGLETGQSAPPVPSGAVILTLDHLILRTADPAATLAELGDRLAAPQLAAVEEVSGLATGILRAGVLDLEVLRVGAAPPERVSGYGLGFTADVPLPDASAALRSAGYPT